MTLMLFIIGHDTEGLEETIFILINKINIVITLLQDMCLMFLFALSFIVYFFGFHQAYTMELEAEVAKLKEKNEELEKKQVIFNVAPRHPHTTKYEIAVENLH